MSYQLSQEENILKIEISDVGDRGQDLLASFQACQEGRCSCPTSEYEKLENLAVSANADLIQLHLTPTEGSQFDPTQIAACLDFTLKSAGLVTDSPTD